MAEPIRRALRSGPMAAYAQASVALCAPATRFILRGPPEASRPCGRAFGCDLPLEACRANLRDVRAALWLGPDEWLVVSLDEQDPESLFAALEEAIGDVPHALVDVSHRQIGVEVGGPGAATLINAGCPLDLDLRVFPVGMCTRTVLAKAEITLWRQSEARFRIEVARSFAPYLLAFFKDAQDGC